MQTTTRKEYRTPRLTIYGTIATLTQGGAKPPKPPKGSRS